MSASVTLAIVTARQNLKSINEPFPKFWHILLGYIDRSHNSVEKGLMNMKSACIINTYTKIEVRPINGLSQNSPLSQGREWRRLGGVWEKWYSDLWGPIMNQATEFVAYAISCLWDSRIGVGQI